MFEYDVVRTREIRTRGRSATHHQMEDFLNEKAQDGWELVGVDNYRFYFKREKDEDSPAEREPDPFFE